jgi:hypothetical protein
MDFTGDPNGGASGEEGSPQQRAAPSLADSALAQKATVEHPKHRPLAVSGASKKMMQQTGPIGPYSLGTNVRVAPDASATAEVGFTGVRDGVTVESCTFGRVRFT